MNKSEQKIIQTERQILTEEKQVLKEIKSEEKNIKNILITIVLVVLAVAGVVGGITYWQMAQKRVYIEKGQVYATKINLSPKNAGLLEEVYVNEGDQVLADTVVARVGNELVKTKVAGTIAVVNKNFGTIVAPGTAVVSMINNDDLRVVGRLGEDKGLKDVSVGQQAVFTVDAFGSKKFFGVVDEISSVSRDSDIVFSISDKREVREFDVKVRFDTTTYPELKSGMSAKVWVYHQ